MLQAKVRGFRGCERADIEIDPISLLAGLNGAGKSSICQAIAAAAKFNAAVKRQTIVAPSSGTSSVLASSAPSAAPTKSAV